MVSSTASDYQWLGWALLTQCSFAGNNFLLSAVDQLVDPDLAADAGISAIFVVWAVTGLLGVGGLGWQAIHGGALAGMGGKLNVLFAFCAGLTNTLGTLILAVALAADPSSAGPITSVLPLNSILVGLLTWVALGEALRLPHIIGLAVAISGPMCMSFADTSGSFSKALALGILTACMFGLSNFLRKVVSRRGASVPSTTVVVFLTVGFSASCAITGCFTQGRGLKGLEEPRLACFSALSGLLWAIGGLCFQLSMKGLAGPASAIANTNSVGVLLLETIFFHPPMKALKLLGMGLSVVGIIILSLASPPKREARNIACADILIEDAAPLPRQSDGTSLVAVLAP